MVRVDNDHEKELSPIEKKLFYLGATALLTGAFLTGLPIPSVSDKGKLAMVTGGSLLMYCLFKTIPDPAETVAKANKDVNQPTSLQSR